MKHLKNLNHLGRTSSHRKAMLANMANSLILHKRIKTTKAKAKALRTYIEPLITKSKEDSTHSRRTVFSYLKNKDAVSELFREVSVKIAQRPGGYTRIIKLGNRLGDNAEMAFIELVDYNETMLALNDSSKMKTSRRRRSNKKRTKASVTSIEENKSSSDDSIVDKLTEKQVPKKNEINESEVKSEELGKDDKDDSVVKDDNSSKES